MPLLLALPLAIVLMLVLAVALWPLALYLRVSGGSARRQLRGWTLALQLGSTLLSALLLLGMAAIAGQWWPGAFMHAGYGLLGGLALGLGGRWLARVESLPAGLYVTPSRVLAWALAALVAARIAIGLWQSARVTLGDGSWPASGWLSHAGLLGMAALLVGFALGSGLWQRYEWRRHQRIHRQR